MKKSVRVQLKSKDNKIDFTTTCNYDKEKNEIDYIELDVPNANVKFNFNNNTLIRTYNGFRLLYKFDETKITTGEISVLLENKETKFDINIRTTEIRRKNQNIIINYEIEEEKYEFSLEVK